MKIHLCPQYIKVYFYFADHLSGTCIAFGISYILLQLELVRYISHPLYIKKTRLYKKDKYKQVDSRIFNFTFYSYTQSNNKQALDIKLI